MDTELTLSGNFDSGNLNWAGVDQINNVYVSIILRKFNYSLEKINKLNQVQNVGSTSLYLVSIIIYLLNCFCKKLIH